MSNTTRRRPEEDTVAQAQTTLANNMNPYQSQWQTQLDDTMNKIMNREKFTYDLNGDALWNQYKDQYQTGGKMAMMDTMGQAAALTGGYGNSYAQGAGQQAYQGYLQGLNDKIPELYQLALDSYNREGDALLQQYGLMLDRENTDYSRWADDRDFNYQQSVNDRNFQYQQQQDQAAADRWQQEFEYGQSTDQRNYDYMVSQDQADRDYQAQQDARNMAMAMLEAGIRPSDEMLASAGLNMEYVNAMYPEQGAGSAGDLTIDRGTKWFEAVQNGDNDWLGSAQGRNWQNTAQGRKWVEDTILPAAIKNGGYDAEGLRESGLTESTIRYLDELYKNSGG